MADDTDDGAKMTRLMLRAGCAPFVVLSFLLVGVNWYVRAAGRIPEHYHWLVGAAVFGLSAGAGLCYLARLPVGWGGRLAFAGLYVVLMPLALIWYALMFGMVVLGEYI